MANEVDLHNLIAIMCHSHRSKPDDFPRRVNTAGHIFESGITEDRDTNIRRLPVLDALAEISVYKDEHQVIAIALQLDPANQKIRLVIAGNEGVEDEVVDHINKIWKNLQALSSEYAENRGSNQTTGDSPKIPDEIGIPLRVAIFRDVHLFSLQKHVKRVGKWKTEFLSFMREFGRRRVGTDLDGFDLNLHETATPLLLLLRSLNKLHIHPEEGLTDDEWETMYNQSMLVSEGVALLLGDQNFGCDNLANELKDCRPQGPFQLRRALEKLTSLSRTIDVLFSFAHSPRLRPALQYEMSIAKVPDRTRTVLLPQSRPEWLSVLRNVTIQYYEWQQKEALELEKVSGRGGILHVHSECSLIHYLGTPDGSGWDNVPPFNYIGVSKLSCSACHLWIEAFNDQGGRKFYTRGSHGKWYWPWAMPEAGVALEKSMKEKVRRKYLAHLKTLGRTRSETDSSDPDSVGAQPRLSAARKKSATSKFAASAREFGDTMEDFYAGIADDY